MDSASALASLFEGLKALYKDGDFAHWACSFCRVDDPYNILMMFGIVWSFYIKND